MDLIFFVYGLAFVLLGVMLTVQPREQSEYTLAHFIWLLAAFGFTHGLLEWTDLWRLLKGKSEFTGLLRLFLLTLSFTLLFEFSRRLLRASLAPESRLFRAVGLLYVPALALLATGFLVTGEFAIWVRYTLGLVGGVGSGAGFYFYFRNRVAQHLEPADMGRMERSFVLVAVALAAYGLLAGLVVDGADFFPADRVNTAAFLAATGVPVQLFRAVCAVAAAFAVANILRVFHLENRLRLQRALDEARRLLEENRRLTGSLERRVAEEVRKNREKDHLLIQKSRLAAMGEMVHNIAHQWRQPLNALGLLLANLKDAYEFGELDRAFLEKSFHDGSLLIRKMSSTIDDFRQYFLPDKDKENFSLKGTVGGAVSLLGPSFGHAGVQVAVEGGEEVCVYGYPNEFSQVLLNILVNAREALQEREIEDGRVDIRFCCNDGSACVFVRDNGGGIPEEVLPKIFDPYFTTKEGGTGIGLYMSRMIMEHMGGSLSARNVDGGAEFEMRLPLACEV